MMLSTSPRSINREFKRSPLKQGQRGAALIVGLIMLLLLTLIGVAGMRDTLLQEKMAANMRDRDVALQAAETALRAAELQLSTGEPVFTNSNGLYNLNIPAGLNATKRLKPVSSGSVVSEQTFWQESWPWTNSNSIVYSRTLPNLTAAQNPRYVIEKLLASQTDLNIYGTAGIANVVTDISNLEVDETPPKPDYRVTARGQGLTADTVVILQATFRRAQ